MAEYKSEIAQALDNLQGLADKFISLETNRRVQLGREKEARTIDAYNYIAGRENAQILELEKALDSIEQNLLDKGVELESIAEINRTSASAELLTAANKGAMELVLAKLEDSKNYKRKLDGRRREAQKVLRHIDLFDDAISMTDPAATGEKDIIEASDVAIAVTKFMDDYDDYAPEIEQRLKAIQTEGELERLQGDYYAKLARESQEKLTAAESEYATADIRRGRFEIIKKESLEGVKAMTYQPVSSLVEQYRAAITLEGEIASSEDVLTGESLNQSDIKKKQILQGQEYTRLGVIFAPWAFSRDQATLEAKNLQNSLTKAGNGNYQELINYLKKGYSQYILWAQEGNEMSETYRSDLQRLLGIDIADKEWLSNIEMLWNASLKADKEQGIEQVKMSIDMFSEPLIDDGPTVKDPLLEEYGFE